MKSYKATSVPIGGLALVEWVENTYRLFDYLFSSIKGRSKEFVNIVKLLVINKLTHGVSVHKILDVYPKELLELLNITSIGERTLYRALERIGKNLSILLHLFQGFLEENDLLSNNQIVDFTSTYFEGNNVEIAAYGYSRDKRSDRKQINIGVSLGLNNIPVSITIQKGNIQDKKHFRRMLKTLQKILRKNSLIIFDAGANTHENKKMVTSLGFHYLTLKPKKVKTYLKYIKLFSKEKPKEFEFNGKRYRCVKVREGNVKYIFFSPELYEVQMKRKEKRFQKEKEKGNSILRKRKILFPSDEGWVRLTPSLQKTLEEIRNPYISGIEGFFILESSLDLDCKEVLRKYKERDKAEKFFRNLKEGLELRPVRHWSTYAVKGIIFLSFLANFLINLTLFLVKNSLVKNVKLLKKYLMNLTLTFVYPLGRFRFMILSNVSSVVKELFGEFLWRYVDRSLELRW